MGVAPRDAANQDRIMQVLGLVCASITDIRTVCAAMCTSSSARQFILANCSGALHLQIDAKPELSTGVARQMSPTLIAQTAWMAQYGQLVGSLLMQSASDATAAAAEPGMQAMLKLLPQLRQLQLESSRPASMLKFLQASCLTSLQLLEVPCDTQATAAASRSVLLAPALSRLANLQELSLTGSWAAAHHSWGPALVSD